MEIIFGIALDDTGWPLPEAPGGGEVLAGPRKMLRLLETWLGLQVPDRDDEVLRIEKYRQALRLHLAETDEPFYKTSFAADAFATAVDLLARRDELLLAGWDFRADDRAPGRLKTLSALEKLFQAPGPSPVPEGFADRMLRVTRRAHQSLPIRQLTHIEPLEVLPPPWRKLLRSLADHGIPVRAVPEPEITGNSDLDLFKRGVRDKPTDTRPAFRGDGSLLLLRGKRDADLAALVAGLLRRNPAFRPLCLFPDGSGILDHACRQEGLPGMGLASASLARPSLQVLKLVTTFLWEPLDPFRVMQFLSLGEKPLADRLANRLAEALAESPGINSDAWRRTVHGHFDQLRQDPRNSPEEIRDDERQYRFWFERPRFDITGTAPLAEIVPVFRHLERWASRAFDTDDNPHTSLLVLAEQSRRIRELLERLPETELSFLELERIVRTVYEPAPVSIFPEEKGHLPYITHPSALTTPVDDLIWWNFVHREPGPVFSRWYAPEREYLAARGLELEVPADESRRNLYPYRHLLMRISGRLILVEPRQVTGEPAIHHSLLGDLQSRFEGFSKICADLEHGASVEGLTRYFSLPDTVVVEPRRLGQPRPFLQLGERQGLSKRPYETYSSLDDLIYYPYKWVFRHMLGLRRSPILKVIDDHTLLGNLSHRLVERMLRQPCQQWSRQQVDRWLEKDAKKLFHQEGAVLLMYGREPERVQFIRKMQKSCWSLLNLLRANHWEVEASELDLEGTLEDTPIRARADLVLRRGQEKAVIDLKWSGASRRRDAIRNREDIQLALYGHLLEAEADPPHLAYYIMEPGRLLARNRQGFREAESPRPEFDHREAQQDLLQTIRATYLWRKNQLKEGRVEVRCQQTLPDLDAHYGDAILDVLEMKQEDARWDDYRALIFLLE